MFLLYVCTRYLWYIEIFDFETTFETAITQYDTHTHTHTFNADDAVKHIYLNVSRWCRMCTSDIYWLKTSIEVAARFYSKWVTREESILRKSVLAGTRRRILSKSFVYRNISRILRKLTLFREIERSISSGRFAVSASQSRVELRCSREHNLNIICIDISIADEFCLRDRYEWG